MKRVADMIVSLCMGLASLPGLAQGHGHEQGHATACFDDPVQQARLAAQDAAQLQELQDVHGTRDVTPRLRDVFERLVRTQTAARMDWRLASYASEMINAHAMHGGGVVVSAGLDSPALPDDAVAAGLAHEMAHVLLGHSMERTCLAAQFTPPSAPVDGAMPQVWSSDDDSGHRMRTLMHSQELQADAKAVELLRLAGYPQRSMSNLLLRLAGLYAPDTRIATASHPDHRVRIEKAVEAESAVARQAGHAAHAADRHSHP
jgi:predicted Zn-dependent protease